jgi:hypothetical protein
MSINEETPMVQRMYFRKAAVEYYIQQNQELVLPRFIGGRLLFILWLALGVIILALLLFGAWLILYTRISLFA